MFIEIKSEKDHIENLKDAIRAVLHEARTPDYDQAIPKKETAKRLDVSVGTLDNWERAGIIKVTRIGKRVYVMESEINRVLNK